MKEIQTLITLIFIAWVAGYFFCMGFKFCFKDFMRNTNFQIYVGIKNPEILPEILKEDNN